MDLRKEVIGTAASNISHRVSTLPDHVHDQLRAGTPWVTCDPTLHSSTARTVHYRRTQTQTQLRTSRGFSFVTWSVSRAPSLPPAVIGWRGDHFLLRRREDARGPRDAFGNRAWPDPRGHRKGPARSVRGSHRRWEQGVIEEGVLWSRGLATLLLQPALAPEVLVHVEREALVLDLRAARTEGPHGAGRRPTAGEPRAVGPPADSRRARAAAECCVGLARTAALCGARQPEAEAPDHGAVTSCLRDETLCMNACSAPSYCSWW